jgi:hypothetical protein
VKGWVEGLPQGLDLAHVVLLEYRQQLALHEFDALQEALQAPALAVPRVVDGSLQVIDHRKEVLDEILVAVLERVLPLLEGALAEVVEVGGQADQPIVGLGDLAPQALGLLLRSLRRRLLEQHLAAARGGPPGPSAPMPRGVGDGVGGLPQRRLQLRVRRQRALGVLRGGGLLRRPGHRHPALLS